MPQIRIPLLSLALVAAAAGAAPADPRSDLDQTLRAYASRTKDLAYYRSEGLNPARFPITGCHAALDTARAAGVEITEEHTKICTAFVGWYQLAEAEAVLTEAQGWHFFLEQIDVATNHPENGAKMAKAAAQCIAEMDRLLAAGMPTDIGVRIGSSEPKTITMQEAKATVCAPLAKAGGSFAKDVEGAKAKRFAELAAPYKAAGITGDRLRLLVDHANYAMYGVGGGELTTPKQLARAKVIFEVLGPGTDGLYTLRRYQFRGHKLVSTTSGDFLLRPRAKHFR